MRFFDKTAFLQEIRGADTDILEANINEIKLVAGDMNEESRKALVDFVRFIASASCQDNDNAPLQGRLSFEELLEIGRHLDEVVQVLSGEISESIYEIARRFRQVKSDAGIRRVL